MQKKLVAVIVFIGVGVLTPFFLMAATTIRSVSNQSLAGWWTFDEGTSTIAHDFSGNGKNGTLQSNPTWSGGRRGNSLLFNGSSDYVDVGAVQNGVVDFSWFAWIKTTQNISDGLMYQAPIIIGTIQGSGDTNDANLAVNGGKLGWYDELAGGASYDTGRFVNDGLWHLVGVTRSGTALTFYVDGAVAGNATTGTDPLNSNGLQIAKANWTSARFFGGNIDDVRAYNRALSASEATALYRSGEVVRRNVSDSGLVGRWAFDEGTSTIAHDFSGNSYNGTLVNSPVWSTGKGGSAILFNGSSNYVIANNPVNFNSNYSVSFWVYLNSIAGYGLFGNAPGNPPLTGGSGNSNNIYLNPNGTVGYFVFDGVGKNLTSTTTLSAGRWYQVSVTHDTANSIRRLYVNGRLEHQDSFLNIQSFGKVIFSFNRSETNYYTGPLSFINGKMDDVRIYNRALSPTEVNTLYTQGSLIVNRSQNNELTEGLVGLWSFNGVDMNWTSSSAGVAYDRSGNNNTGVLTNMSQIDTPVSGKVGQALLLDGSNDYVQIPSSASLLLTGDLSISLWVKPGSTQKTYADMISKHNCGGYIIEQSNTSTNQYALAWDAGGCSYTGGGVLTTLTANVWQHFTVVKSGANITHYVNGVQTASGAGSNATIATSATPLRIGNFGSAGGREFNGALDEVRIYNRALSATEAKQLYLLGR